MALILEQPYIDEMIAHAREDAPNECCGIIAGVDGRAKKLYRAINAEASPYRYSVEPRDLLRIHREVDSNDWDFLAIYHSHTHTEAYPPYRLPRRAGIQEVLRRRLQAHGGLDQGHRQALSAPQARGDE